MMDTQSIINLIVFLVVLAAIIALTIFIMVRNAKYNKFVLLNSESIKKLNELNKKYIFKTYNSRIGFQHRFDSKRNWNKTEPVAFLTKEIRDNLETWFDIRNKIDFNRETLKDYNFDVDSVDKPMSVSACVSSKMNYKKCLRTETKIFRSKVKKPLTDIFISVSLRYVSRGGKVDLTKTNQFGYVELVRILDSVSTRRVDRQTYERLATAERAMLSDGMRYDVLRRDGFRCTLCGMSSKDGAILHVDHIIPVSKGGKSVMSNLRTLCEKCNIGKSNKIE